MPTVGIEFETKFLTLKEGHKVKLQIWDTGMEITNQLVKRDIDQLQISIYTFSFKVTLEMLLVLY